MGQVFKIKFEVSSYFKDTYGFDPGVSITAEKSMDLPYHGFRVARASKDGMRSYLLRDKDVPFEESVAQKILNDPNVDLGTHCGCIFKDGKSEEVTDYYVQVVNKSSSIFQPTVFTPISDCSNVDTEFEVEVVFAFGDGLLLPVRKAFETGGSSSINFMDVVHDIYTAFEFGHDGVKDFFDGCPNARLEGDELHLIASTTKGRISELDFSLDESYCISELQRAIASIRLVRVDETIK